jgi:hypothetical protein
MLVSTVLLLSQIQPLTQSITAAICMAQATSYARAHEWIDDDVEAILGAAE